MELYSSWDRLDWLLLVLWGESRSWLFLIGDFSSTYTECSDLTKSFDWFSNWFREEFEDVFECKLPNMQKYTFALQVHIVIALLYSNYHIIWDLFVPEGSVARVVDGNEDRQITKIRSCFFAFLNVLNDYWTCFYHLKMSSAFNMDHTKIKSHVFLADVKWC